MKKSLLLLSLLLALTACDTTSKSPETKSQPPSGPVNPQPQPGADTTLPFDAVLSATQLTLSNREQGKINFSLKWNSYKGMLYSDVEVNPPQLKVTQQTAGDQHWLAIDAVDAPVGNYTVSLKVHDAQSTPQFITRSANVTVSLDSSLPSIAAIPRQRLQPGEQITLPLTLTPPTNGTVISDVQVISPAPDLIRATLTDQAVTLHVNPSALFQGLIPVTVQIKAGGESAKLRIPVEIGDVIEREFQRFNIVRSQANLPAVSFDADASMNCWMHGRYGVENDATGHTEDLTLPFATPEGRNCASNSNLAYLSRSEVEQNGSGLLSTDVLFRVPFHAVSMLRSKQTSVGIGSYVRFSAPGSFVGLGGITSNAPYDTTPVMFPGNGATTDLSRFYGAERPDPLTSCPNYDPTQTGLPLIISVGASQDTTATDATLTEDGQSVAVCVFGSTQYVNTTGHSINYPDGPVNEQTVGRRVLKGFGAVFIIPQKPLNPSKTYAVALKVNGKLAQWSFKTSATLRVQSLKTQSLDAPPPQ